jgi:ATP:ADP antiporter, AAA family
MCDRSMHATTLEKLTGMRPTELPAVAWSVIYVASLFMAVSVLRPIRDELGVNGGIEGLPWLFTAALLAMLLLSPAFAYVVRRFTRGKVVSLSYRFLAAVLIAILLPLSLGSDAFEIWAGRAFFIWISLFNLFVVSVFWSFMEDVFNRDRSKRLFGVISVGATIGGLLGAAITGGLVTHVGRAWLVVLAVVLVEVSIFSSGRTERAAARLEPDVQNRQGQEPIGGGLSSGLSHVLASRYLTGMAGFVLIYSITSTFLYFQQASYAETSFATPEARTEFFARIDLWVHALTLLVQVFLTSRIIAGIGVLLTLCVLPVVSALSFAALATCPSVCVFVVVQVARRVASFALARPAREILFTSANREERFKAKNFIDTVIYRGGDQFGSWSYAWMMSLGFGISQIALVGVPLSLAWLALSFWLARSQQGSREIHEPSRGR